MIRRLAGGGSSGLAEIAVGCDQLLLNNLHDFRCNLLLRAVCGSYHIALTIQNLNLIGLGIDRSWTI